jgi:hypothetical protein
MCSLFRNLAFKLIYLAFYLVYFYNQRKKEFLRMNTEKLLFMPDHHPEIQYLVIINPDPNWAFPLHSHDDALEISLIFSGVSHFTCQNKTINVMKDSLIVKNAGLPHSEKSDADSPIT